MHVQDNGQHIDIDRYRDTTYGCRNGVSIAPMYINIYAQDNGQHIDIDRYRDTTWSIHCSNVH